MQAEGAAISGGALYGMFTELIYSVGMRKSSQIQDFINEIKRLNGDNKVTLIAGYNATDL